MTQFASLRTKLASSGSAMVLIAASVSFFFYVVIPLARQVQVQVVAVEARTVEPNEKLDRSVSQRFFRSLPNPVQREKILASLPESARRLGLTVDLITVNDPVPSTEAPRISSQTGRIIVVGSYEIIRRWLTQAVHASPGTAINTLQISPAERREPFRVARIDFVSYASADGNIGLVDSLPAASERVVMAKPNDDPFRPAPPLRSRIRRVATSPPPTLAFPYTYGGNVRSNAVGIYLLINGDQVIRVRVGDTLPGGHFRLDNANAVRLEFTDLTSGQHYHLPIGNQTQ